MSVVLDDGSSQYLLLASGIITTAPCTFSAWVKSDDLTILQVPVCAANSSSEQDYFELALRGDIAGDYIRATVRDVGASVSGITTAGYSANTWTHVIARYVSGAERNVLINGGNEGEETTSGVVPLSVDRFTIGCLCRATPTGFFSGKVAEVAVWDTDLTDAQVTRLAAGDIPSVVQSDNLQGYWRLEDGALDSSGNGNNLTLVNAPTYDSSDHPKTRASFTDKTFSKKLVSAGNNEIWYESAADTMSELSAANGDIDTLNPLVMFEAFEKVFVVNGTNLKVADFGNTKLQTDDIKDEAAGATSYPFHNVIVTGAGGAKMVIDYITDVDTGAVIYGKKINAVAFVDGELVSGINSDATVVKFDIKGGTTEIAPTIPHWYDWTVYGNSTTYGAMPDQATSGCLWRGRPTLSGDKDYPHQWYQARQRNPWDWNYVSNDAQSPVAGGNSDAGEVGDIVVALIPYNRDYLIYGCASSLWVLAGDAAEGGSLYEFESTAGILGRDAWCWDKEENLYLLITTGILKIPKGFGPGENLTEQTYPDFIKDLAYDVSLHRITMGYDRDRHGIKISKTTLADGTNSCWWYDLKVGGLFPDTYPEECGIFSMFHYEAVDPDYRKLLFGCNDGYIRFADDDAEDDDIGATDEAIDSYITFGPLKLGSEGREGKITSLLGIPTGGLSGGSEADSSDLEYKIWAGQTADIVTEKLIANTSPAISGTIEAQQYIRGKRKSREIRGMFAGIRVGNDTATETWGLERLLVNVKESGRL